MISQWEQFMVESNDIEGECGLNPNDTKVMKIVIEEGITSEKQLLRIHGLLTDHLDVDWSGRYRRCDVRVGGHIPPGYYQVPVFMKDFFKHLKKYDCYDAHNLYEHIHPFEDFNGRTGRLIWLSKAYREDGYRFNIPFLRAYYYQSLNHYHYGDKP